VIPVSLRDIFAKAEMDEWVLGISVGVRNDPSSKRSHKDLTLSLVADVGVSLVGSVTSPKEPVSVHSPFNQQYEVILTGTSPVESLYFRFKFPASKSGEPLLALRRPTVSRSTIPPILLKTKPCQFFCSTGKWDSMHREFRRIERKRVPPDRRWFGVHGRECDHFET